MGCGNCSDSGSLGLVKTLHEATAHYIDDPASGLKSDEARRTYRNQLVAMAQDGPRLLGAWTEADLVGFCHRPKLDGTAVADNTIRIRRTAVTGFFSYCHWKGWISADPSTHLKRSVRPGTQPVVEHHWLTADEVSRVLGKVDTSTLPGRRDDILLRLGFTTGLRAAELSGLTWSQVDLDRKEITVVGKGRKLATVALSANTWLALVDWHSEAAGALGRPPSPEGGVLVGIVNRNTQVIGSDDRIVFGQWDNPGLSVNSIQKRIRYYSKLSGVVFAPHDMRRTFAGLLAERVDIAQVSRALRHSTIAMTQAYLEKRQDAAVVASRLAGIDF